MKKQILATFAAVLTAVASSALDATFVQNEVSIPYTPTTAVSAGDVMVLSNGLVAVADRDIDANALGAVQLRGVFKMAKDTSTTYVGQLIYWDADGDQYGNATTGTGAATTTASGNTWCGFAVEAKGATDGTVEVMLYPVGNVDATDLTVSGNTTMAGTLAVTGIGTFTAESVHNGGIDADYITVDASATTGIDTKTAGELSLGGVTATSVTLGDTGVGVTAAGPLTASEDILSNELDAETATALLLGKATATGVTLGATDAHTTVAGSLTVNGSSITLEGSKTDGTGYLQFDTNGTGANTNVLLSIGGSFTIGDDGAGTLVETNAALAAEFCIGILINGERYNILLEKP